jgi:aldose 1-epimerase
MKKKLFLLIMTATLFACNNTGTEKKDTGKPNAGISEKPYGNYEGKPVTEYTITNSNGMQVGVINYGGIITKIIVPDKSGQPGDVVTGFEDLDGFLQKGVPYFGALIGRYGNRIAKAKFLLDGKEYTLAANDGANSLHGGNKGYDKVYWNIEKQAGDSSLKLTYLSKDGEEGYPGNMNIEVLYTVTAADELIIEYTATADKATPVNLTSHAYFNLSGGEDSTILGHDLMLNANRFTPVDSALIPTGELKDVKGGAMDFNTAKPIGRDIAQVKGGYDHNWVLNKTGNELTLAASLYHPSSGRLMEVFTTEPGIQFYSGNFLDGSLTHTKGGARYNKHYALCLETQHYPDSPNQSGFPTTILKPGEKYKHTCIYKFSAK